MLTEINAHTKTISQVINLIISQKFKSQKSSFANLFVRCNISLVQHNKINYLCTYDLYGPVRNVFDAGRYITWGSGGWGGGGVALEIESFLGPFKWHEPILKEC
jgi:hypothetical protein